MRNHRNKLLLISIVVSLLMSCFITVSYAYAPFDKGLYYGDVDDNNVINAEDALVVLMHVAKLELIDETMLERAEVDGDKVIDAEDALEILKFAATLIDEFPVTPDVIVTDTPEPTEIPTVGPTVRPTLRPTNTPKPQPTETEEIEMPEDFSGTVWIMGDSIAARHEKTASVRPLHGWGELIGEYFSSAVKFHNHAISSQSTSSYYSIRKTTYDYVFNCMKENDYAIISFGHNDHNGAPLEGFDRTTDPEASTDTVYSYKWWLKNYYIDPVLKKGATPILMSSVVRCTFENNVFYETDMHMKYGVAMEELVAEYAAQGITIYYIDAQDYTYDLYSTLSKDEARLYHGQYGTEASNYFDNTHFSEEGARMLIDYMISELEKTDLSIVNYIKK